MKFKKVEIQGFRAYGDKEDATFDFTENNDVVDLISIYAPNGFGKTSFYDAIEWSVTHKIKRIESALSNYDLIKTEKDANREGNKLSDALQVISKMGYNNPEKFVNIETTTKPFNRKIESSNRKGTVDYDQTTKLENPNFRDVILSQEGINSFLVAEKPEDRYKNFVQHFDSHDLDRLYRNLVVLRKENEKRSKVLESDKAKINKQLKKKIDIEVSEKINQLISELDGLEIKLDKISQEFDLSDLAIFKSDITGVRNEIELGESSIIEKLKKKRNLLTQVQQNIPEYISNFEQKGKLLKLIENLSKLIFFFGDLSKKSNRKDKLFKSLKLVKTQKDDFKILSDKLPGFKKVSERLEQIKKNKEQKGHYLIKLNNLETLINLNSTTFRNRQLSFEEKIINIEQNSNIQKSSLKNYKKSLKEISNLEIKLKPQKQRFKDENNILNELKTEIEELLLIEKNSKSEIYKNNKSKLISKDSIDKLKKEKVLIVSKEKEISITKKKLNDSKSLQENLNYLIELGTKIVNNTKQSDCPLCKNEYGDFKNLLEKINLNNLLVESSKENTFKITHLESELKELKEKFDKNADSLVSLIRTKIEEIQFKINKSINKIETLGKDISSLEKGLEKHKSIIEDHKSKYQKIDLEKRFVVLEQEIKTFQDRINIYEKNIEKYNLWIDRIKEKKSKSNLNLFDLDKDLKNLLNDSLYKNCNDLLSLYNLDSNKQKIEAELKISKKEFENLDKEISNLDKDINILKDKLKEFKLEELKLQESDYQKGLLKLNSFESEFNKLIQSLNISTENIEKDLNLKIISNKTEIAKNEFVIRELSKIEKLLEPLGEFLNYNELKRKEESLNKSINLNEKIDTELKKELENISNRIKLMIKKFFFDGLINKIYNKIDPHPQYREINFKVDFSDYGFPKLNIFTDDGRGSGNKVPNLYFSTAQMNILSLSIFLAKALHAVDQDNKSIDTIFIDDPVQAMDSINVLSVIDLLRNIITNHKKQIIISTHDENFFNLLKKKIPKNYFKSKFLELETFGKLKKEDNKKTISDMTIDVKRKDRNDNDNDKMSIQ